ncbi:hypothetical protein AKJ61_01210 [candidate division MSBL1 archaeon SCGC-AAA259B11]|uniref:SMP-30/Gluconolactonase/LRE-like region domain-containing protein n=1 Tax=candidate division MSBL1 archaeon SCGC-AAA259B11 TaxID=1698260 RepID=A0A133U7P0_9EURY|nr:hypothetical protein AKJ61_01210 [candidate division MSBL1 archaeon SCGC-AAA259B11]
MKGRAVLLASVLGALVLLSFSVQNVRAKGVVVDNFDSPARTPKGLAWDGTHLWHADYYTGEIYELKTDGSWVSSFVPPGEKPGGLAWDGTHLWVGDFETDKIYELDTEGNVLKAINSPGSSPGTRPEGLAWDGTHLWVAVSRKETASGRLMQEAKIYELVLLQLNYVLFPS